MSCQGLEDSSEQGEVKEKSKTLPAKTTKKCNEKKNPFKQESNDQVEQNQAGKINYQKP